MAIEDHPKFAIWKAVLERLVEAKRAFKNDEISLRELEEAELAYVQIVDDPDL